MPHMVELHNNARLAMAELIAAGIVENAGYNEEDPATYSTSEEVVMLYCGDIVEEVSRMVPHLVRKLVREG